jgi:hypothetical protein
MCPWGSRAHRGGDRGIPSSWLGAELPSPTALPTQVLLELTKLLASRNNYAHYRRTWAGCTGFRLPVLGVHLKDLVSLHQAQPDRLPDGRLHLSKLNGLYLRLQELATLQRQHPPCSANEDLLHLLTVSCLPCAVWAPRSLNLGFWDGGSRADEDLQDQDGLELSSF